jgi:pilus assembly protein Flp/PilA
MVTFYVPNQQGGTQVRRHSFEPQQRGTMITKVQAFFASESAATAIEYAIIACGLSIVIVAAVNSIGTSLNATFTSVSTALK